MKREPNQEEKDERILKGSSYLTPEAVLSGDCAGDNEISALSAAQTKAQPKISFSPELLATYYSRLFPFEMLHSWLSYDPSSGTNSLTKRRNNSVELKKQAFSHREFSFTIEPVPDQEIYIRYQCFSNAEELRNAVLKRNPRKIDIGAIFSHPPKDHLTIQGSKERKFKPCQRELVFDIDLTDYDGVRKCGCQKAEICLKCWKMMTMALKVVEKGLRSDFGFQHIAWFYSGRRGIHAWVCDENARKLSDSARSAVATYLEVNLGSEHNENVELTNPLHPMLSRAYEILQPMFIRDVLPHAGHGILSSETRWNEILETLPSAASAVRNSLQAKWRDDGEETSPEEKWTEIKRYLKVLLADKGSSGKKKKSSKTMSSEERNKIELWPVATVFRFTYPRLDINVSKMQNHLLKSPFCVHPKTGRVCVPIDARKVDQFDPFHVPTLPQLMEELDSYDDGKNQENNNNTCEFEWEKTSLKESFTFFQKEFLRPMIKDWRLAEKEELDRRAAMVVDF